MIELPGPWVRPDDIGRAALVSEVRREVSAGHALTEEQSRVVDTYARCGRCSLVCFDLGGGSFALVRLTWSGFAEAPPWPRTSILASRSSAYWAMAVHAGDHHEGVLRSSRT